MAQDLKAGKEVLAALKARGVGCVIKSASLEVELSLLPGAKPAAAREIIYKALNGLEPHFSVFLRGAPACFMPDAWDHALYSKMPGRRYFRFAACGRCSLAALCPGLERGGAFDGPARRLLAPVLPAPAELVLELTKKCNLNCRLCFSSGSSASLPLSALKKSLKEARALGVRSVRFTGGEPFLSPHLLPILKEARRLGFYTLVNTNAALNAPALFRKAAPLMDNVLVSLQAPDPAGEKAATGADFGVKLANMRLLRAKVPVFRLGTVASKSLIRGFGRWRALAAKLEADIWEIYRPMPDGRGAARSGDFDLGSAELKKLSKLAAGAEKDGLKTLIANPVPLCLVPPAERKNLLGAAFDDGHTRLVLDPRGFYKPSYYIEENLGPSLKAAWGAPYRRSLVSFAWLPARCRRCRWLLKCLGGSRALARAASGTYFAGDPWL
jgi:pyrroloquinoline quinone biosynthesis protein E